MKKLILLLMVTSVIIAKLQAQIPNWGMESWTTITKDAPTQWGTFGYTDKVTPGNSGTYAVKLHAIDNQEPGVVLYGQPSDNNFLGGIPFDQRPDSLIFYAKYNIAPGDSAWVVTSFKKSGLPISMDNYKITGAYESGFKRMAFKMNYNLGILPDTLFIGFTSTDPDNGSNPNSYIIIDDISFIGATITVPNAGFENWTTASLDLPDQWTTENSFGRGSGAFKTTSAYAGNYAIKLVNNINTTTGDTIHGYAMTTPPGGPQNWGPAFPMDSKPDSMFFYAKFFPQNEDTATVAVIFFKDGNFVGSGGIRIGNVVNSYQGFGLPIYYDGGLIGNPDSAIIILTAYSNNDNSKPKGNSEFYVDNMSFDKFIPTGILAIQSTDLINIYPVPAIDKIFVETPNNNATTNVEITDISGRILLSVREKSSKISIDLSGLDNKGLFFIKVTNQGNSTIKKIILN